jgi:hypothetical protein
MRAIGSTGHVRGMERLGVDVVVGALATRQIPGLGEPNASTALLAANEIVVGVVVDL